MRVKEYLQKKYCVDRPTSLLAPEARVFGVAYPLQPGWWEALVDREMTPRMVGALQERLKKIAHGDRRARAESAQRGLKVLAGLDVEESLQAVLVREVRALKKVVKAGAHAQAKAPRANPVRGGMDVNSDAFLASYEWRRVRMAVLKRDGARCACCGATPATGAVMNVDHIKPRRLFPHLALEMSNLQVLCGECNHGKGNWDMTDWRAKVEA